MTTTTTTNENNMTTEIDFAFVTQMFNFLFVWTIFFGRKSFSAKTSNIHWKMPEIIFLKKDL